MAKIKRPSEDILVYIKDSYSYDNGLINGLYKFDIGVFHNDIIKIGVRGRKINRSHIVWYLNTDTWPMNNIVHLDGDKLNDKIENLKDSSDVDRHSTRKNSKLYKGISITLPKGRVKWRVRNKKYKINLGSFSSEKEAKLAVDKWIDGGGKWWI